MSHIKVQFSLLKDINLIITTSSKNISEAKDDFKNAISKLDWEVKAQSDISVRAARAIGELRCYNTSLNWYGNYLDTVYSKYAALENWQNKLEGLGEVTPYASNVSINASMMESNRIENQEVEPKKKTIWSKLFAFSSKFLKLLEKYKDIKVKNGAIADVFGVVSTIVEVLTEGFNSVGECIASILKMWSKSLTALSKCFKDAEIEGYGYISSTLTIISEAIKMATKGSVPEALKNAGGLMSGIGNFVKTFCTEVIAKQLISEGFTKEVAWKYGKELFKKFGDKIIAPIVAIGGGVTRLVGDVCEMSKDGFNGPEIGEIMAETGLATGAGLLSYYTLGLVNIDVDKTWKYIDATNYLANQYWSNTDYPQWLKVIGSIVGTPVNAVVGIMSMVGDDLVSIYNGIADAVNNKSVIA